MPGSPPNSVSEPGTRPPPRTLLSSLSSMLIRGSSDVSIRLMDIGEEELEVRGERLEGREDFLPSFCSTKVFHSPHEGQRPIHLGES